MSCMQASLIIASAVFSTVALVHVTVVILLLSNIHKKVAVMLQGHYQQPGERLVSSHNCIS